MPPTILNSNVTLLSPCGRCIRYIIALSLNTYLIEEGASEHPDDILVRVGSFSDGLGVEGFLKRKGRNNQGGIITRILASRMQRSLEPRAKFSAEIMKMMQIVQNQHVIHTISIEVVAQQA